MERRDFVRIAAQSLIAAATAQLCGCGGNGLDLVIPPPPAAEAKGARRLSPNLILQGDETKLAGMVKEQFDTLFQLAQTGQNLIIQYTDSRGRKRFLSLSYVKNKAADYLHPRLVQLTNRGTAKTGKVPVNLVWGLEPLPKLKLTDDNGTVIMAGGRKLEYALANPTAKKVTAGELLVLGVKVAAAGLLIWLGATIGKAVLGALAFVAFNAAVIGLLVAGGALVVGILKGLGLTWDDVRNFFNWAIEQLAQLFRDIGQLIPQ